MKIYFNPLTYHFITSDENSSSMATCEELTKSDTVVNEEERCNYVKRLVYDVLVYTLSKCGLSEDDLPCPNQEENVYDRANFIESAGLSTLRVCLMFRDKWIGNLMWQHNNDGFNDDIIAPLFDMIIQSSSISYAETKISKMFLSLAIGNEFVLFLYHVSILNIDLKIVLDSVANYIYRLCSRGKDLPETMLTYLGSTYYGPDHKKWLTSFIERYAKPYGSIEGVSDLFFKQIKFLLKDAFKRKPKISSEAELRNMLGFLPFHRFKLIKYPIPVDLPEESSEQNLSGGNESSKLQNLPPNPAGEAVGGKESRDDERPNQSENVSEQAAKVGEEQAIEDNLSERNLAAAISQPSQGAIPKRRKSMKESGGKQSTSSDIASVQSGKKLGIEEILDERNSAAVTSQASQGAIPKRRKPIQEFPGVQSTSSRMQSTSSDTVSDQIVESGEKLGIEEDLGKMSLASEEVLQLTEGAIPKSRRPIQEILERQSTPSDCDSEGIAESEKLEIEDKTILAYEEAFYAIRGVESTRKKAKNKKKEKW